MGGSTTKKTEKKSEYKLPEYMRQGSATAVQSAMDINNRPYEAYTDKRIADMSQNEQMGINAAKEGFGNWGGDFASAREALGKVGSITDNGVMDTLNPYMRAIANPQIAESNRAFEEQRARSRANAGMTGSFGGRQDVAEAALAQGHERNVAEITGSAFGAAADLYGAEQNRYIQKAGAYQQLGMNAQQAQTQDIKNLMDTGLRERTRDQAELDFKYLQHLEERDWDIGNLDTLVKTLQSVPHNYTQEETIKEESSGSPLKAIAGIAAITAGAIMTGGASLAMISAGSSLLGGSDGS